MDTIDHLLTRGVDTIYPSKDALESLLRSGKKLTLYQGFDPSGTQLHIGHAVAMRKLREFQDLGHKVIFLIGDFTGMIGDPTGKAGERKVLTHEQVLENARSYQDQAKRILRFDGENPIEIKFNSHWLSQLTFKDVIELAAHFTVQQMIERDMFDKRLKANVPIHMHEFFYPLMQGYDSVAMDVDLEVGGTDQMFNMMAGRTLMHEIKGKEKFVLTVPLLSDSRGVKIGKTEGNAIGLTDAPNDFFGKMMSLGDDAIIPCFTLLTDTPMEQIEEMKKRIEAGDNPMQFKKRLARQLTAQLNTEESADEAQRAFESTFQNRTGAVDSAREVTVEKKEWNILDLLITISATDSKSEARRLVAAKAVDINGVVCTESGTSITLTSGDMIKVGKKTFVKILLEMDK